MSEHPRARLDELIHQPVRFSIAAALAAAEELEFGFVRDTVGISDSLLSRYVTQLELAGYVAVRRARRGSWRQRRQADPGGWSGLAARISRPSVRDWQRGASARPA